MSTMKPTENKLIVCGKFRSGKDLVSSYLVLYYDFQPFAFADELKSAFHRAFPEVPTVPKPRAGYQKFGEWACEMFGDRIWINKTDRAIHRYNGPNVLISDMRKQIEHDYARENGFTIIRINASDDVRITRAKEAGDDFNEESLRHYTEVDLDNFSVDFDVDNSGTTEELYAQLDAIMASLGIPQKVAGE